jgi:hypothetical protein
MEFVVGFAGLLATPVGFSTKRPVYMSLTMTAPEEKKG